MLGHSAVLNCMLSPICTNHNGTFAALILLVIANFIQGDKIHFHFFCHTLFDMINDNNLYEEDTEDYYNSLRLVRPFDGLKDDQAFYISSDGYLWLIFDSKTPEFYVDFSDCTSLSFDVRKVADFDKYVGKKSLFASEEAPVYHFLQGDFEGDEIQPDIKAKFWEMVGSRSIYITNYSSLYDSLTSAQLKAMSFDEDYLASVLETLIKTYDEETEKGGKYVYGNLAFNSYPSVTGNYLTVYKYFNANVEVSTENDYFSIPVAGETDYYNFRNGKEEALSLEDIFAEGTDVRIVLKDAMYKELENSQTWIDTSSGDIETLVDYAVDNISSFQIELDHLSFNIPGLQEKFNECFADFSYSEFYDFSSCVCYVDYRYIGCENLTLF